MYDYDKRKAPDAVQAINHHAKRSTQEREDIRVRERSQWNNGPNRNLPERTAQGFNQEQKEKFNILFRSIRNLVEADMIFNKGDQYADEQSQKLSTQEAASPNKDQSPTQH